MICVLQQVIGELIVALCLINPSSDRVAILGGLTGSTEDPRIRAKPQTKVGSWNAIRERWMGWSGLRRSLVIWILHLLEELQAGIAFDAVRLAAKGQLERKLDLANYVLTGKASNTMSQCTGLISGEVVVQKVK